MMLPITSANPSGEFATGTKSVVLPTFGIAAEYALTPHLLFRVDASGFGLPHKSNLWDAHATLSFRVGSVEIQAGAKMLHAKSGPGSLEYESATVEGVFGGVIWHAPFFERTH